MVLEGGKPEVFPSAEIETLRVSMLDLRSAVARMSRVLDRMEEQERQQKDGDDA